MAEDTGRSPAKPAVLLGSQQVCSLKLCVPMSSWGKATWEAMAQTQCRVRDWSANWQGGTETRSSRQALLAQGLGGGVCVSVFIHILTRT